MAANKLVAVFLMCTVVLAAVHVPKAEAAGDEVFKKCFEVCQDACFQNGKGNGYTFCEVKCDEDCGIKEVKAKIEGFKP